MEKTILFNAQKHFKVKKSNKLISLFGFSPLIDYAVFLNENKVNTDFLIDDITQLFILDLVYRKETMQDVNILITGGEGMFKSKGALALCTLFSAIGGRSLYFENVKTSIFGFSELLHNEDLKPFDILWLDESDVKTTGLLAHTVLEYTTSIQKRMRALQIYKVFCSTTLRFFGHYNFELKPLSVDRVKRTMSFILFVNINNDLSVRVGVLNLQMPSDELYNAYLEPKMNAIENARTGLNESENEAFSIAEQLISNKDYVSLNNIKIKKHFITTHYPQFNTIGWIDNIYQLAEGLERETLKKEILNSDFYYKIFGDEYNKVRLLIEKLQNGVISEKEFKTLILIFSKYKNV
jgi:hypothetical protein